MNRIIIVSNRLPFSVKEKDGKWQLERIVSGLITSLEDLRSRFETIWIGWQGIDNIDYEVSDTIAKEIKDGGFIKINLRQDIIEKGYNGFVKKELWGIFHNYVNNSRFIEEEWNAFVDMNKSFAQEILNQYQEGDIVYLQDFQLMLVPEMVKATNKNIKIGFFLHIPFPAIDIFKLIPCYKELVSSLSQADYVGFHTELFAKNYKDLCIEENCNSNNIDINPIGINFDKLIVDKEKALKIRNNINTKIILGCERSDFPKGIIERLSAYEFLLEKYPDIRENVTLVQIAVNARKGGESYDQVGRDIQLLISEINGKYSTLNWTPIIFINRGLSKEELFNLYSISDICSVNSLADGLNLTAFEYCGVESSIGDRSLILSKFTGAADILLEADIINPRDITYLADVFYRKLKKPSHMMSVLREKVKNHTMENWINNFLNKINS